jgi:putative hydrolase of the HAD superfamily
MDDSNKTRDDTALSHRRGPSNRRRASNSEPIDRVDTVLFDLDGTVCEYERSPGEVLGAAFDRAGVEPFFDVTAYYDRFGAFVDESEDIAALRRNCFVDIANERGRDPALGRAVAEAFASERDHARVIFVDGAGDVLTHLDGQGYGLGLVTNGPPGTQRTKLDSLGVTDRFETAVFAGHETPSKPHPEPFTRALDTLGAQPGQTLFVGDSLDSDIAGAQKIGMQTAWVTGDNTESTGAGGGEVSPGFVLESTGDLRAVLSGPDQ